MILRVKDYLLVFIIVQKTRATHGQKSSLAIIIIRVNYTPLPSKMLELYSPPLLC